MVASEDIRIAIGYQQDQQSVERVVAGTARLAQGFEYVDDAAVSAANAVRYFNAGGTNAVIAPFQALPPVVRNATQSFDALEQQSDRNVRSLYEVARANERVEDTLERLSAEHRNVAKAANESTAAQARGATRDRAVVSGSVRRGGLDASSQLLYAAGQRESAALVNVISDLGAAARSASPELVIITAALSVFGILIQKINEGLEAGREKMRQAARQIETYYDAIQTGTEATIRAQRDALTAQLSSLEAQQAAIRESLSGYVRILQSNLVAPAESLIGRLGGGEAIEGNAILEQLQRTIDETIRQITALDSALNNATVRERSYVQAMLDVDQMTREEREAALERLRNEGQLLSGLLTELGDPQAISEVLDRTQELRRQIEFLSGEFYTSADAAADLAEQEEQLEATRARQIDAFRRYIALELQLQDMDAAARKERVEAIRREIDLARLYLSESVGLDTEVVAEVEAGIAQLEQEMRRLQAATNTTADALNRATDAQNVRSSAGGRGDALTPYYDRLTEFGDRVRDAADDLLEANETLTDAQAGLAEANRERQALDTELQNDQRAAAADTNTRLEEIQRDHEAARSEIVRKGETDRQRILRQSNALISNAYAQRDALAAYLAIQNRNQQLADQKDQETEALAQADTAAEEQRGAAAAHYRDALNDLQRRYDQEKTIRDRAVQQARADVTNAEYNLRYIREQYNNLRIASEYNTQNQVLYAVQQGGAAIVQQWGLIAAQSAQAVNAALQNMANQRQALPAGGIAAPNTRGGAVTINVAGAQLRTIDARSREQAYRVMDSIFGRMGITE